MIIIHFSVSIPPALRNLEDGGTNNNIENQYTVASMSGMIHGAGVGAVDNSLHLSSFLLDQHAA